MATLPSAAPRPVIALIGAGLMGGGLARVFRRPDWEVRAWDLNALALRRLCDQAPGTRAGTDLEDTVRGADLVVEAIVEKAPVKQALFAQLAAATSPSTLLATNSSVIPVAMVAALVTDEHAGRVLGMHFWNPPDLIPLVEVIQGPRTAADTVTRALSLLRAAGKEPVHVRRDVVPGNRLQHALWREAMALVDEGVCTPEDVDHIVKRSFGARLPVLGPLENADLVGLELTRQIHEIVLPLLSRATEPAAALKTRLDSGRAGVSSGEGFYSGWDEKSIGILRVRLADHLRRWFGSETG